jgi:hypothetical protein
VARRSGVRAVLVAAVLAVLAGTLPATAGGSGDTTTADVPTRRALDAAVIRTTTADSLVQVNVDIGMQVKAGTRCRSGLPGVCKGSVYHPCFNLHDPAYKGCQLYTLFRVLPRGTAHDLAQGITIGNTSEARDGSLVEHGWAGKVTQADLEFYAYDPLGRYGDARMRVPGFPHQIGTTAFSDEIGHVSLPRLGAPDAGVLVGTATGRDGAPMPPGSFKLDLFGHGDTGHPTGMIDGTRFTLYGFGGAKVPAGTTDGSFRSKPLWFGHYDLHLQRKGASYRCKLVVQAAEVRFDVHFGKKNLGQRCTPMRPLAQGVPG